MIFSTQHQLNCVLIFIFFGIISGLIYSFFCVLFLKKYQKKLIKLLFLSIIYSFFSIFFIFLINFFNFGKFSLTLFLSHLTGFSTTVLLLRKLVVIFEKLWYNKINEIFNRLFIKLKKRKQD